MTGAFLPTRYEVTATRALGTDVVELAIAPVEKALSPATAGQFLMLWPFGQGEAAISVADLPSETGALAHIVRAVGPISRALCRLSPGDELGVRGPFGVGWPTDDEALAGADLLLAAGGLGYAPLRPVVRWALEHPEVPRSVTVLVGARQPDQLVDGTELDELARRPGVTVARTVDRPTPGWGGDVGVITELLPGLALDPARTVAMVCGPELMMRFTATRLTAMGVPPPSIFVSLERNMACGEGRCGHCQLGPLLLCRAGPVVPWHDVADLLPVREL